jgi:hypothetical protein
MTPPQSSGTDVILLKSRGAYCARICARLTRTTSSRYTAIYFAPPTCTDSACPMITTGRLLAVDSRSSSLHSIVTRRVTP